MKFSLRGLQEAQQENLRMVRAVSPSGGMGRAVQYLAESAHRFAVSVTHVDTGALRASHRLAQEGASRWRLYLDPNARNPRSGARTSVYGPIEHDRGGEHEFYERTIEAGPDMVDRALVYVMRDLP